MSIERFCKLVECDDVVRAQCAPGDAEFDDRRKARDGISHEVQPVAGFGL